MPIATDSLSLVFIGCFLFGLLFLLGTVLLGSIGHGHGIAHDIGHSAIHHVHVGGEMHHAAHFDHAHVDHAGSSTEVEKGGNGASGFSLLSIINPSSVVFFLLVFGFSGYVFHNETNLSLPLTLLYATLVGCVIAGLLVFLMNRLLSGSNANTIQDVSDRTGLVGKVIMTIQENDPGEILYESPGGLRKSIPARSIDGRRIERGQEVVVTNFQNGIAEVDTWDHFIGQDEGESLTRTSADDLAALQALLESAGKDDEEYVLRKDQPK